MTELPTAKQGAADQLSATRGSGLRGRALDLLGGPGSALAARPSAATDLEHSFSGLAKFFLPGKTGPRLARGRAVPEAGCDSTSSTTSTSRPVGSSTS
jgi:hypothetical protein